MRITERTPVASLRTVVSRSTGRNLTTRTSDAAPCASFWTPSFASCGKGRRRLSSTLSISLAVHGLLITAALLVPLFLSSPLPLPGEAVHAFFTTPAIVPPPPPPPPPPAAMSSLTRRALPAPARDSGRFTAPIEVPDEVAPERGVDLGVEGGVAGGVEGGVAGGIVGAVVGGLAPAPRPPPPLVRVGGQLKPPRLVKRVQPAYPPLAEQARVAALVILEAEVDAHGSVRQVRVLRGHPLFDEAAVGAVRQWIYEPLLLNGQPTPFLVTVTMNFSVKTASPQ
jgi:protein TonB